MARAQEDTLADRDVEIATDLSSHKATRRGSMNEDPFTARVGKTLTWSDVNMTVTPSKGPPKKILTNVWGEVPPGEVTAIEGPSGAGKSSLLNILAGRTTSRGNITVTADIRLDNYEVKPTKMKVRRQIAYVAQEDSLQITATPRESIRFSAKLRLPRSTTEEELDNLTDKMLTELGLTDCADTFVGGGLLKGVSGGEKKRTSVGVELVVKPAILLLDEPTSGLDSFSAVQLVSVLKKVANAGASVLFTIHQPSSDLFESFDNFILLKKGRVMYQGPAKDVPDYFAARGYVVPPRYNPADFVMNVAQIFSEDELEKKGFFSDHPPKLLPPPQSESSVVLGDNVRDSQPAEKVQDLRPVSFSTEVLLIFTRELKGMTRNKKPLAMRTVFSVVLGLLVGIIFLRVGKTDPSIPKNFQSHFGGMMVTLMTNMVGTTMPSLVQFPMERPVFLREYSTDHYGVASYFFSRLASELIVLFVQVLVNTALTYSMIGLQMNYFIFLAIVFSLGITTTASGVVLGCLAEDAKTAVEFLPLLLMPQFLFAGFFVATDLIPIFIRWAQYLCSMTYSIRLAIAYEFEDCTAATCQGLIAANGISYDDVWWYWLVLLSLFVAFRVLAVTFLRKKATKFL